MSARIETGKAIVGAQPQSILAIRLDPIHDLSRDAAERGLVFKAHRSRLDRAADHAIEAAACGTDPQLAMVIEMQRVHRIVAETGRIAVVAPIGMEVPRFSIEQIEPAALGADPEVADGVLDNGAGARAAERGGRYAPMGIARDLAAALIDPRQSPAGFPPPRRPQRISVHTHTSVAGPPHGSSTAA